MARNQMALNSKAQAFLLAAGLATFAGCDVDSVRGFPSDKPPIHLVQDMDFQQKIRAQSEFAFEGWSDQRGARKPVGDSFGNTYVVARGSLADPKYAARDANGQFVTANPLPLDHEFLVRGKKVFTIDRGQECFEIHCAVCHGYTGQGGNGKQGHGIVGRLWNPAPPSFHFDPEKDEAGNRVPNMPDGEYFDKITNGHGTMPAYGARMSAEERWAVVRALQSLSR